MYLICNWRPDKKLAKFVWSSQCPHVDWLLREVDGSDGGKEEGFVPEKGDDHHGAQGDGGAAVVAGGVLPGGKGEVSRRRRHRRRQRRRRVACAHTFLLFFSFCCKACFSGNGLSLLLFNGGRGGGSYQPHVHEVGSTRPAKPLRP